jgi:predicted AlkP superfamily pyrophosphatase or phosphodiesterase
VLLHPDLEPVVDLVCWTTAPDRYEVASADGHLRFHRTASPAGRPPTFSVERLTGRDFLANQDPAWLGTLAEERRDPHPTRLGNAYPHAYEHMAQLFDHPSAPDLVVLHTGSHFWGEQGGHLGEHGSLGVLQARAPFIAAGAGVAKLGTVDDSCRLVDIAPTVLELLGAPPVEGEAEGRRLLPQDGSIVRRVVERPGGATQVVAFLLDGTNPNVLYDLAGRGEAPNIARLMGDGTTFRHGAVASLPTVTLANHTSIITGLHPGHHGVLHNAWVDRVTGRQVVTNSPTTWLGAMQWLAPGTETVHHAVHRAFPGALSVSINEPCDTGADFSVFELMRRGEEVDRPPQADDLPDATQRFVRPSKDYRWSSKIDHTGVDQFRGIWSGRYRGSEWPVPTFTWVNFTLTDAAFHEGGPYSEIAAASVRDTDARIGRVLEAVEQRGVLDSTAFILVADHGMQLADEAVTGDWDVALAEAGVAARDEGYGFVYLTPA